MIFKAGTMSPPPCSARPPGFILPGGLRFYASAPMNLCYNSTDGV